MSVCLDSGTIPTDTGRVRALRPSNVPESESLVWGFHAGSNQENPNCVSISRSRWLPAHIPSLLCRFSQTSLLKIPQCDKYVTLKAIAAGEVSSPFLRSSFEMHGLWQDPGPRLVPTGLSFRNSEHLIFLLETRYVPNRNPACAHHGSRELRENHRP